MQQYQLLRNNKESGPYTAASLIEKGLKPYDLIWATGKTAAWQYPSEVSELKAFAPIVEEQPFDRFYKKPQIKVVESTPKMQEPVHEVQVATEETFNKPAEKPRIRIRADWKRIESKPIEKIEQPRAITKEKLFPVNQQMQMPEEAPAWRTALHNWEKNNSGTLGNNISNEKNTSNIETGFYANGQQEAGGTLASNEHYSFLKKNKAAVSIAASFILLLGGGYFVSGFLQNKNEVPAKVSQTVVQKSTVPSTVQEQPVTEDVNENNLSAQENPDIQTAVLTVPVKQNVTSKNSKPVTLVKNTVPNQSGQLVGENAPAIQNKPITKPESASNTLVLNSSTPKKEINKKTETISTPNTSESIVPNKKPTDNNLIKKYIQVKPYGENNSGVDSYNYKVSNVSQTKLDLVMIDLQYFDASGKFQKGQTVYVKNLSPDQSVIVSPPDAKQAAKITYKVSMVSAPQNNLYLIAD